MSLLSLPVDKWLIVSNNLRNDISWMENMETLRNEEMQLVVWRTDFPLGVISKLRLC